jgi:epoxyqueuosine reductase
MSKFHSTVTRRDFMKGLGLAGTGIGAAAATAPVFHDLDELTSWGAASPNDHPWYVKKLELEKPVVEIDWTIMNRLDRTRRVSGETFPLTATSGTDKKINATAGAAGELKDSGHNINWMKDKFPDYKGPDLRTDAMLGASSTSRMNYSSLTGQIDSVRKNMGEPLKIDTPEEAGFPAWSGSPEDNLRTLRNAARFFGAAEIGVIPLTSTTRKMFDGNRSNGTPINFKDVDNSYQDDDEYAIANKNSNLIHFATLESYQAKEAPGPTWTGYEHYSHVERKISYFLQAMGFNSNNVASYTRSVAWGTLGGVCESSRACMIGTSYKYGNMFRGMHRMITNMPLAPTNPVDAGVGSFCKACKTCSESCPYDAMPMGDASWEHELAEEESLKNYTPGFKGWRLYNLKCIRCKNCHGTCPFNSGDDAMVHDLVRAVSATTPLFNGFMASMHRAFGYGTTNPNDFWESSPPIGLFAPEFVKG